VEESANEPTRFELEEDGPGDLLDASSSPPPSPPKQDPLVLAKQEQALVLAERREKREAAKEMVKARAEGSLVTDDFDFLLEYFVTTWLEIQLRSCWRPIFTALRSDFIDEEGDDGDGTLTRGDLKRIVMSGLEILDDELIEIYVVDLKKVPDYAPPTEEEVERRVARYMMLDTNGDGEIDLKEFSVRFLSLARNAMLSMCVCVCVRARMRALVLACASG
jgi:hypothetical protein